MSRPVETPWVLWLNGQAVARVSDPDDGLHPQYEGLVHDIALGLSRSYDGVVTVTCDAYSDRHEVQARFEDGAAAPDGTL